MKLLSLQIKKDKYWQFYMVQPNTDFFHFLLSNWETTEQHPQTPNSKSCSTIGSDAVPTLLHMNKTQLCTTNHSGPQDSTYVYFLLLPNYWAFSH